MLDEYYIAVFLSGEQWLLILAIEIEIFNVQHTCHCCYQWFLTKYFFALANLVDIVAFADISDV